MKSSSLPASLSFSTTFFKYPVPNCQHSLQQHLRFPSRRRRGSHTLELSLKILLRSKRPLPTRLISQEIQSEPIDHIDDLFGPFLERLLLIFGRRVCANVDVVSALCDLSAVDFVDNVVDIFEVVGVGDDLVAGNDVL